MDRAKAGLMLAAAMLAVGMTRPAHAVSLRDPTEAVFSVGDKNADVETFPDSVRWEPSSVPFSLRPLHALNTPEGG